MQPIVLEFSPQNKIDTKIKKQMTAISWILSHCTIKCNRTVIHLDLSCYQLALAAHPNNPHAGDNVPKPIKGLGCLFLFGLAPTGVYHAKIVTNLAVRSYRTLSPLPPIHGGGLLSVALSLKAQLTFLLSPFVKRQCKSLESRLSSTKTLRPSCCHLRGNFYSFKSSCVKSLECLCENYP